MPTTLGACSARPPCIGARADLAAGAITADQLRQAEDDAISGAVRMQEETGLSSATDGEFRRAEWHTDFIKRLGGIREAETANDVPAFGRPDPADPSQPPRPAAVLTRGDDPPLVYQAHGMEVTGKVHLAETIFADHFSFLASAVTTAVPKLTIPSPSMAHFRADISASGYADSGRVPRRPRVRLRRRDRRAGRPRLHLPPARRHPVRVPERPGLAREGGQVGR